ncbi:sulfur carrier protein ThiS [Verrucomicrobiaceae bacterium N1E253]|uniref:Sulfur carrier protein ThiS n=1 Tax=Oceaniferula marina TaxID=2748318 RepID=A0A851GPZ1_9BACT|nr:sulfur carrier protein ThiS [Oceaniferula marina]NWK56890.1 sulfur carrier protein ThiS [Oceaniferula marina]
MITLTINGQEQRVAKNLNVKELLTILSLEDKPVVVELNRKALFPREYANTPVGDQDQLEIITIAAGG